MPKYRVNVTQTTIVVFDPVEIETDDEDTAKELAEDMAADGSLTAENENEEFTTKVEEITEA